MSSILAKTAEEVLIGIEFEFGVESDQEDSSPLENEYDALNMVRDNVQASDNWRIVSEHTGWEANSRHPHPLGQFMSRMTDLFERLYMAPGIRPIVDHQGLVGMHIHVNVENDGPCLHLPTLWKTYIEDGFQERMFGQLSSRHRRDNADGNHERMAPEDWVTVLAQASGQTYNVERNAYFAAQPVRWTRYRGWDFNPRNEYGSVEFRTWEATLDVDLLARRYQFLIDLANRTIANTPEDANVTNFLGSGEQIPDADFERLVNIQNNRGVRW